MQDPLPPGRRWRGSRGCRGYQYDNLFSWTRNPERRPYRRILPARGREGGQIRRKSGATRLERMILPLRLLRLRDGHPRLSCKVPDERPEPEYHEQQESYKHPSLPPVRAHAPQYNASRVGPAHKQLVGRTDTRQASACTIFMKTSSGMDTLPVPRSSIFFLPRFCLSRSLFLRVTSPP